MKKKVNKKTLKIKPRDKTSLEIVRDNKHKKRCVFMAVMYLVCSICWLISAYLDFGDKTNASIGYVDISLGTIWVLFAIFYYKGFSIEK